jgi:hypothetical protein
MQYCNVIKSFLCNRGPKICLKSSQTRETSLCCAVSYWQSEVKSKQIDDLWKHLLPGIIIEHLDDFTNICNRYSRCSTVTQVTKHRQMKQQAVTVNVISIMRQNVWKH